MAEDLYGEGTNAERAAVAPAPGTEYPLQNVYDAENVLELGTPVDTMALLKDTSVLMYGEDHPDYAVADHLLSQVDAFKKAGVTSFGIEMNPDPAIQKIYDEINAGNIDKVREINWSLGYGNPTVRQTKQELIVRLVKAGIKIYPYASWSDEGPVTAKPYEKESEEQAAEIIQNYAQEGKTVVLAGARHAEYGRDRTYIDFPRTADCVKKLGVKTRSVIFAGGMQRIGYNRSPEALIQRAAHDKLTAPLYIDTTDISVEKYNGDGILVLPEVPFLAANKPIPPERMPVGGFTPLENIRPIGALQNARDAIAQAGGA